MFKKTFLLFTILLVYTFQYSAIGLPHKYYPQHIITQGSIHGQEEIRINKNMFNKECEITPDKTSPTRLNYKNCYLSLD